jgi:hypothetical protein
MVEEKVDEAEKVVEQEFTKEIVEKMVDDAVAVAVEETSKGLNANFQKRFDEIKKEKQEVVESKKSYEEETRLMVEKMSRDAKKSNLLASGVKAYSTAGLEVPDDEVILDMIREDSEDPLRVVKWNIDTISKVAEAAKLQGKDEVARAHGRTVTKTDPTGYGGMTYQQMQALPDAEFNKIPSSVVQQAVEAELKH